MMSRHFASQVRIYKIAARGRDRPAVSARNKPLRSRERKKRRSATAI